MGGAAEQSSGYTIEFDSKWAKIGENRERIAGYDAPRLISSMRMWTIVAAVASACVQPTVEPWKRGNRGGSRRTR